MTSASRWLYRLIGVAVLALAIAAPWPGGLLPAFAWDEDDCQECHGDLSIREEGGSYLYVDPARYERTAHADVGCPSCHESVTNDHPQARLGKRRDRRPVAANATMKSKPNTPRAAMRKMRPVPNATTPTKSSP